MNKLYGDTHPHAEDSTAEPWKWDARSSLSCPRCDGPMTVKEEGDLGICSSCYLEEFRATARIGRPL